MPLEHAVHVATGTYCTSILISTSGSKFENVSSTGRPDHMARCRSTDPTNSESSFDKPFARNQSSCILWKTRLERFVSRFRCQAVRPDVIKMLIGVALKNTSITRSICRNSLGVVTPGDMWGRRNRFSTKPPHRADPCSEGCCHPSPAHLLQILLDLPPASLNRCCRHGRGPCAATKSLGHILGHRLEPGAVKARRTLPIIWKLPYRSHEFHQNVLPPRSARLSMPCGHSLRRNNRPPLGLSWQLA